MLRLTPTHTRKVKKKALMEGDVGEMVTHVAAPASESRRAAERRRRRQRNAYLYLLYYLVILLVLVLLILLCGNSSACDARRCHIKRRSTSRGLLEQDRSRIWRECWTRRSRNRCQWRRMACFRRGAGARKGRGMSWDPSRILRECFAESLGDGRESFVLILKYFFFY